MVSYNSSLPDVSLGTRGIMAVSGRKRETSLEGFWQDGAIFYSLLRESVYITELLSLHNLQYINLPTVSVAFLSPPGRGYPIIQPSLFSHCGFCVTLGSTSNYKSHRSSRNIFWKTAMTQPVSWCIGTLKNSPFHVGHYHISIQFSIIAVMLEVLMWSSQLKIGSCSSNSN